MIDKRLFLLIKKRPLVQLVIFKLSNLSLSIGLWYTIAAEINNYFLTSRLDYFRLFYVTAIVLSGKLILNHLIDRSTYSASAELRITMRSSVMKKAFKLGNTEKQLAASKLTQYTVDGIEQLEIYYARFLPQLFYCLFASLLIFGVLAVFALRPALILLLCLPVIPIIIMAVMKLAKKILAKYWQRYTNLGTKFHENLSSLSVLKAYDRDEAKQIEMTTDAEKFRKVTMSLLSMQLNSITIMDIVSYSGAALGIGLALFAYQSKEMSFVGMLLFTLLSAEFFLPMRQLGSLFHVAMNGISACKNLFDYLEIPEPIYGNETLQQEQLFRVAVCNLDYRHQKTQQPALKNFSAVFQKGQFTSIIGKSGSGKSTLVKLLIHQATGYQGDILWNQQNLKSLAHNEIKQRALLIDNHGYLYPKSIRENLRLAAADEVDETALWRALEQVHLTSFVNNLPNQLDEVLNENGSNLSGGQRQRLILARALLSKADLFIFDEITSGVDLESEKIILSVLAKLAKETIVIFISHRLYNTRNADQVLVLDDGLLAAGGRPAELMTHSAFYRNYFNEEAEEMGDVTLNEEF